MRTRLLVSTALAALMGFNGSAVQASDGTVLLPVSPISLTGVSSVAGLVVGYRAMDPYSWDLSGTQTPLPIGGAFGGSAHSVSDTGVIVGDVNSRAALWTTPSTASVQLTSGIGMQNSTAYAISRNGAFITGIYYTGIPAAWNQAFIYNAGTQTAALLDGYDATSYSSYALGVTNDGSVISGTNFLNGTDPRAAYWYSANGGATYSAAILLDATHTSKAQAVSADGSVIVGQASNAAVRWVRSSAGVYGATQTLGSLGGATSVADGVSGDGSVIVGTAEDGVGTTRGFRWTSAGGMTSIEDWFSTSNHPWSLGATYIQSATAVSTDGTTVVGRLSNGNGYIVRVGSETPNSGLITLNDLATSLSSASTVPSAVATSSDLAMHGSHGHPLSRIVAVGKATAWMDGDIGGAASHDDASYNTIGEIGGGYRFSRWVQANLALGKMYAGQKTVFDGKTKQDMTYILPEAILNWPDSPFWLTVSGQYADGDISALRGYLNAGNIDSSKGETDVHLYAARVRLDWRDAVKVKDVSLTPYFDHQHTETRLAAYTETTGAFPVRWNARTQSDDVSRIGFDAHKPLNTWLTLNGTVEEVHWWQGRGEGATGTVIGLSDFALPGEKDTQDWARFGLGLTAEVGNGQLSAMANASTQGSNPKYWMGLGYQIKF